MPKRRALLIGVPKYDNSSIRDLPVAKEDVELIEAAIRPSGYSVDVLGLDQTATGTKIKTALANFLKESRRGDTLLIHYSGHGVHFNGKDYLVPFDGDLDHNRMSEFLVPLDLDYPLQESHAQTILFFVDACREGIELTTKSLDEKSVSFKRWGNGRLHRSADKEVAFVFGCSAGELCRFVTGETRYSLFSKALADVLDANHEATTFGEILSHLKTELSELCRRHHKPQQTIKFRAETDVDQSLLRRKICEGNRVRPGGDGATAAIQASSPELKMDPRHLVVAAASIENWSLIYEQSIERIIGGDERETDIMRSAVRIFVAGDEDAARLVSDVCDRCERETGQRRRGTQILASAFSQFVKSVGYATDEVKSARTLLTKRINQTLKLAESMRGILPGGDDVK